MLLPCSVFCVVFGSRYSPSGSCAVWSVCSTLRYGRGGVAGQDGRKSTEGFGSQSFIGYINI